MMLSGEGSTRADLAMLFVHHGRSPCVGAAGPLRYAARALRSPASRVCVSRACVVCVRRVCAPRACVCRVRACAACMCRVRASRCFSASRASLASLLACFSLRPSELAALRAVSFSLSLSASLLVSASLCLSASCFLASPRRSRLRHPSTLLASLLACASLLASLLASASLLSLLRHSPLPSFSPARLPSRPPPRLPNRSPLRLCAFAPSF